MSSTQIARIALLALRASVEDRPLRSDDVLLAPNMETVSSDSAVSYLSSLPKPVECSADVVNAILNLRCDPVTSHNDGAYEYEQQVHRDRGGLLAHDQRRSLKEWENGILVTGRESDAILVSPHDLDLFQVEYMISTDRFTASVRPPRDSERNLGARWVVDMGRFTRRNPIWVRISAGLPSPLGDWMLSVYHKFTIRRLSRPLRSKVW